MTVVEAGLRFGGRVAQSTLRGLTNPIDIGVRLRFLVAFCFNGVSDNPLGRSTARRADFDPSDRSQKEE